MSCSTLESPGAGSGVVRASEGRDRGELRWDASVLAACVVCSPGRGENRDAKVSRFFKQEEEDGCHLRDSMVTCAAHPPGEWLERLEPDVSSVLRV